MRIAITGATGHLGANLVRALVARGEKPRVLIHRDTRAIDGLPVEIVRGDILDSESLVTAFKGIDRVYHLAAQVGSAGGSDEVMQRMNVEGTANVIAACRACKVKRLLHCSSIRSLNAKPYSEPLDESRSLVPEDFDMAYDRTKAQAERLVLAAVEEGLDAVIVNPTGVFGPFDFRPSMLGGLFISYHRRRLPGLVNGGFDWVDVRDVVDGILRAADKGRSGERYILGGYFLTMPDLAQLMRAASGVKAPLLVIPMPLAMAIGSITPPLARLTGRRAIFTRQSLRVIQGNPDTRHEKAARELGYSPRPIDESVSDTFTWFAEAGML